RGSCGRRRRTIRLMTTDAACAPNAPTPAATHCLRFASSPRTCAAAVPAAASPSQPSECSPKCERPRAAAMAPGRFTRAFWIATSRRASPSSGPRSTDEISIDSEDTLPAFFTGQLSVCGPIRFTEFGKTSPQFFDQRCGFLRQGDHLVTITLPVHHTTAVGGGDGDPVDAAEAEPARLDGRVVRLRHLVVARVRRPQVVHHRGSQCPDLADRIRGDVHPEMRCLTGCPGQLGGRGQNDRIRVLLAHRRDLGQGRG
ncbi:MAG: hypothetical protein K0R68_4066, partial [Mycobacterium sp.]|nr:hypothetical protein [Mycobacterium sp.]